jgi:hypothetical protein
MVLHALAAAGGKDYLVAQAGENPVAFLTLIGRCLPKEIMVRPNLKLKVNLVGIHHASRT